MPSEPWGGPRTGMTSCSSRGCRSGHGCLRAANSDEEVIAELDAEGRCALHSANQTVPCSTANFLSTKKNQQFKFWSETCFKFYRLNLAAVTQ